MAYVSVGTGYKSGGVGPRPFNAEQAIGFGPEKLTSYEIGLKTDLFDRKVRFNTAVFYNDFKDAQLVLLSCPQFGGPGPCALPQNAGDAKVSGVEVEITAMPVERSAIRSVRIVSALGLEMREPAGGGLGARVLARVIRR